MLHRLSPYSFIDSSNPVFQFEHRQIHWLRSAGSFRRYNLFILIGIPIAVGIWALIEILIPGFGFMDYRLYARLAALLSYLSIGVMFLTSIYTALMTTGRLSGQRLLSQWDLLRLTPQSEEDILKAHDTAAQFRVWRIILLEILLRLIVVELIFLNTSYDRVDSRGLLLTGLLLDPEWWLALTWSVFPVLGYIIEPILRMRLLIALGIAVGVQIRNSPLALLASSAAALSVHLAQATVLGVVWYIILASGDNAIVILFFVGLPSAVILFIYYARLCIRIRKTAHTFILRKAFEPS